VPVALYRKKNCGCCHYWLPDGWLDVIWRVGGTWELMKKTLHTYQIVFYIFNFTKY
jgi:hypothetical protein